MLDANTTVRAAIAAPDGHRTFTVLDSGRLRCACGHHVATRRDLAAHHALAGGGR